MIFTDMTRLDPAKYDRMKDYRDTHFDIPDKTAALLIRFLKQGVGQLARRAGTGEFRELTTYKITVSKKNSRIYFYQATLSVYPFRHSYAKTKRGCPKDSLSLFCDPVGTRTQIFRTGI